MLTFSTSMYMISWIKNIQNYKIRYWVTLYNVGTSFNYCSGNRCTFSIYTRMSIIRTVRSILHLAVICCGEKTNNLNPFKKYNRKLYSPKKKYLPLFNDKMQRRVSYLDHMALRNVDSVCEISEVWLLSFLRITDLAGLLMVCIFYIYKY